MFALRYRTNRVGRFPGRRGAAAVEFAVTAPILFMLLFGALELGRMNMIRQTANNAAYEAARTCIVPGATNAEGVAAAKAVLASIGVTCPDPVITPGTDHRHHALGDGDGRRPVQHQHVGRAAVL